MSESSTDVATTDYEAWSPGDIESRHPWPAPGIQRSLDRAALGGSDHG